MLSFNLDESCEIVLLETAKGNKVVSEVLAQKLAKCARLALAQGIAKIDPTLAAPPAETVQP